MKSCCFRVVAAAGVMLASLLSMSCGSKQHLVSITVSPTDTSFNLTGLGQHLSTQFTAKGSYIHPPDTRDITSFAVWKTDSPTVLSLDPKHPGLVTTTGLACGTNLAVTASVYSNPSNPAAGAVISAQATVNVAIPECSP